MVDSLSDEFRILASRYLNSVYEREPLMSGSDDSDCSSASDESSHQKRKPGVPDAKKRGGLMKLAQSLSGGNRSGQHKSTSTAAAAAATAAANKVKLKTEDVWDTPSTDSSETEVKNRKNSKSKVKDTIPFLALFLIWANRLFTLSRRKRIRRRGKTRNRHWEVEI